MITHSTMGTIHLTAALLALVFGGIALAATKGDRLHRTLGAGYVAAMVTVNLSSLGMYGLTGSFNLFHALALLSLAAVGAALVPLIRREAGWLYRHYRWMTGSYFGLLAAATIETSIRVPALGAMLKTPSDIMALGGGIAVASAVLARLTIIRMKLRYAA